MSLSLERSKEIDAGAGKVGCSSVVAFIIFLILSIFSGGNIVFIVLTILAFIIPIICALVQKAVEGPIKADYLRRTEEENAKRKEAERIANENAKISKFYDQCIKEGIYDINKEASIQKASLIAESLDLHMSCIEAYSKGKSIELDKIFSEEKSKYKTLTQYSECVGRSKSIKMIEDLITSYKKQLEDCEKTSRFMLADGSSFQEKEHDWAVASGVANGLAGGAAAVATAMEIQQKNAEIRARNEANQKAYIQSILPAHMRLTEKQVNIKKRLNELERTLEKNKIKLIENSDEHEILNNINFTDIQVVFSPTGTVGISAKANIKNKLIMFEDTPAIIDGTIKADLYQKGVCVGSVLMVAPIDGINTNKTFLEGIVLKDNNDAIKDEPYEIKFEPYHLWKMEA